jgi:ribosomal 30S subunit maturation factor RimM
MATHWQKIGTVGMPQGLNGSFFVIDEHLPSALSTVVIGEDPTCGIPANIESFNKSRKPCVLKIRGINGREALSGIRGQHLWVDVGDNPEESFEGLSVIGLDQSLIGKVIAVTNHGASDIVVIENEEKRLLDIPLVEDYFSLPPASDRTLQLRVPLTSFSDFWYE